MDGPPASSHRGPRCGLALALAIALAISAAPRTAAAFAVAVTVDDIPWVGGLAPGDTRETATGRILAALHAHGASATGFVVCDRVRPGEPVLRAWLAADHSLGNHTASHPHIDQISDRAWRRQVVSCQERIVSVAGAGATWFRFPYLQTGRTPQRRDRALGTLAELGLRVAPVTIDSSEWALHEPYVAALRAGDRERAEAVGAAWIEHVLAATRHYRAVARARTGDESAHVLLLHANATAADYLERLLAALEAEGAHFVSLEEALADPVFARPDDYAGPIGLSWLYRFAPQTTGAWVWDEGQWAALRLRFGGVPDDRPVTIDQDLRIRPLAPRTWVVTHEEPWPANTLVAELANGALLLVDTPYTPDATERLLVWLRARFGPRERVAVNTHFHWDALGGNAALQAAGVPVYGSEETARLLAEREEAMRAQLLEWLGERPSSAVFRTLHAAPPDHRFPLREGLHLTFGTDRVEVLFPGPSHAQDMVVVHLPDHGVLFGGCAVLAGDRVGNRADAAPLDTWAAAIRALRDLPARHVVPGHGDRADRGLLAHTLRLLKEAAR